MSVEGRGLKGVRRIAALVGAAILLAGCQTFLPYINDDRVPTPVVVADASPERLALNAEVYDSATRWVGQRFYRRDFGGVDWAAEVAARRDAAIAQPTEADFYDSLNELLGLLNDRHTNAVTPTRHLERALARRDPTPNLGFGMRVVDDQFIVTSIRPGGPADLAGVKFGWRVERLNGEPVNRQTRLRKDLDVQVVVFTDGEGVDHEVSIPVMPLPPYVGEAERRPDGVLVLSFDYFGPVTRRWLDEQMRAAIADPPAGIVLDLRDNSGGVILDVGRALAHFFPDRRPYAWIDVGYLPRFPYRTRPPRQVWTGPAAVIIGDGSASGAEVFAATFQETGRGQVIGLKSLGAVIASRQLMLPDGGELSIGVRSFRSGAGHVLEGVGVTPDREVKFRSEELRQGRDAMIEAAAEAVLGAS